MEFAKSLLPLFFKHNKLSSFIQQLYTYGFRRVKHYKVMEYDLDARKYTVINYDVEGPIEYIEILDEKNIEVYVEVIPVEESSEEEEEEEEESALTLEEIKKMKQGELVKWCRKYHLFTNEWLQKTKQVSKMRPALAEKLGLEGSTLTDKEQKARRAFVVGAEHYIERRVPRNIYIKHLTWYAPRQYRRVGTEVTRALCALGRS